MSDTLELDYARTRSMKGKKPRLCTLGQANGLGRLAEPHTRRLKELFRSPILSSVSSRVHEHMGSILRPPSYAGHGPSLTCRESQLDLTIYCSVATQRNAA